MSKLFSHFYDFGPYRLDVDNQILLRDGVRVALMPKTIETLLVLVERAGQVVGKEELMQLVWPDVIVEENNLNKHISKLRKVFGENGNSACYIETLPRRGYRFVAQVQERHLTKGGTSVSEIPAITAVEVNQNQAAALSPAAPARLMPAFARHHAKAIRLLLIGVLAVTIIAVAGFFGLPPRSVSSPNSIRSLAVLPLLPLSSNEEELQLGLSLADGLISRLDKLNQFVVRPVRVIASYTDKQQDPVQIGERLQVDAVLDGSLQYSGNRLRVTLRLLHVDSGQPLWSESFEGQQGSTFVLQDELTDKIAERLAKKIGRELPPRPSSLTTLDDEVRAAYMRGRYLWNRRTDESVDKAIAYFRRAVEKDPQYAPAWAGLAEAYVLSASYSHEEKIRLAKEAGQRALALDETLAPVYVALAFLAENFEYDWQQAEHSYKRAIELNPNYTTAHHWYGECLAFMGRFEEAIAELECALEIEPFSLPINKDLATVYAYAGQRQKAIELYRKTLELDPNFTPVYDLIAAACEVEQRYDESVEYYLKSRMLKGVEANHIADLRAAYARSGWQGFWQQELKWIRGAPEKRNPGPYLLAQIHLRLGEREQAIKSLRQALATRHLMSALKVDAIFTPLHNDPRFTQLLQQIGLS
ncbi:MAG TPA: tetratricopeptide repeat protein [Blastocatellia bacterium]|nr:tetratricopeptide repeat protein [Blastocatellia bacterium]